MSALSFFNGENDILDFRFWSERPDGGLWSLVIGIGHWSLVTGYLLL